MEKRKYRLDQYSSEEGLRQVLEYKWVLKSHRRAKWKWLFALINILGLIIWPTNITGMILILSAVLWLGFGIKDWFNPQWNQHPHNRLAWWQAQDLVTLFKTPAGKNVLSIYQTSKRLLDGMGWTGEDHESLTPEEHVDADKARQAMKKAWLLTYEEAGLAYDEKAAIARVIAAADDHVNSWHRDLAEVEALSAEDRAKALEELESLPHRHNPAG